MNSSGISTRVAAQLAPIAVALTIGLSSACNLITPELMRQELADLGSFEFSQPRPGMKGIVVRVPHASSEHAVARIAKLVSGRTGAGYVAAHGFKSKRISVSRPLIRTTPYPVLPSDPAKRGSVFPEFKNILRQVSGAELDFYVEVRSRHATEQNAPMVVTTSGLTFDQAEIIKRLYSETCDHVIGKRSIDKLPIVIDPEDEIAPSISGVTHHGALLIVKKGISLSIPPNFFFKRNLEAYSEILPGWLEQVIEVIQHNPYGASEVAVTLMNLGRFDSMPGRGERNGVVLGAPHGTYDEHTADVVRAINRRTGLAAVISRGFTPTEAAGWRINVNRPTEKSYLAPEFEITSLRAQQVYEEFKRLVLDAAGSSLDLYVDVHQYGRGDNIQVATVGVSSGEAREIKSEYETVRERVLKGNSDVEIVELAIEPLDAIEIGAWPAKAKGILSVAKRSLHFELPLRTLLRTQKSRHVYTQIIAELCDRYARILGEHHSDQLNHVDASSSRGYARLCFSIMCAAQANRITVV